MVVYAEIEPTYARETGLLVLRTDATIPFPENFVISEQNLIYLPPKIVAGNHSHPRIEVIIGVGELELIWLDEDGHKHIEEMMPEGQLRIFTIEPNTPHAVINKSETGMAVLYEYADSPQHNVTPALLI